MLELFRAFALAAPIVLFIAPSALRGPTSPDIGVCVHLGKYTGEAFKPAILHQLDTVNDLGGRHVRWDAAWSVVETTPGVLQIPPMWDFIVDQANARGIDTMLILDYGNRLYNKGRRPLSDDDIALYGRYAEFVVRHFHGRVKYFEIWNEWDMGNGGAGYGTAEEYVRLAAAVYPRLKRIAPDTVFLVGGSSREALVSLQSNRPFPPRTVHSFFERTLQLGLLNYGDGLSVHPYTREETTTAKKLAAYRQLMTAIARSARAHNGGRPFPIYVTEFGWPVAAKPSKGTVSAADQAYLIAEEIRMTRQSFPDVRMMSIYQLTDMARNKPGDPAYNYGLTEGFYTEGAKKPAYYSVRGVLKPAAQ